MSGRDAARAGTAAGASGMFTITLLKPGSLPNPGTLLNPGTGRQVVEHWAYDARDEALDELGWIAARVAPGTELVLRDPEGLDLLRITKTA